MGDSERPSTRLADDMKVAMKAGEKVRLGAIRRARAAIKNAEIEAGGELAAAAEVTVLRRIARQHRESIEQFTAGGRDDLVAIEREELAVLETYLPAALGAERIEAVVREVIAAEAAAGPGDLGRVMKAAMARLAGQAEGGEVNAVARRLLAG